MKTPDLSRNISRQINWSAGKMPMVAIGVFLIALWQLMVTVLELPVYVLPGPLDVLKALRSDSRLLFTGLLFTLKVTVCAFAVAVTVGVLISFLLAQNRTVEQSVMPYMVILQVTPIVAIAPLIIIWISNTFVALVTIASITALFPIVSNMTLGLRSVAPNLHSLFRIYRATRWQTLTRLKLKSALPYFFAGARISSGLALIGAVVAEFVAGTGGTQSGLAYIILESGVQLKVPRMFASLFLISLTGIALFAAMVFISNQVLGAWHESTVKAEH
ncbi:MAG: transporter ATP-binding protein [Ramlibacter sp.]|nr:transporter ATP-binding protein [Ramlibacter sp.]